MNIIDGQARDAIAITKSDTVAISVIGIYVGGTGDLVVVTEAEFDRKRVTTRTTAGVDASDSTIIAACNTVTFPSLPVGFILNLRVRAVKAASTTTNLVGYLP